MMHGRMRVGRLMLAALLCAAGAPAQNGPSVLVQLTRLYKGSLPRIVTAYGRVQASTPARHTVMAPVAAVVDTVYVHPGESVGKDAPLLRLVPSPAVGASYAQAESALRVAGELVKRTRRMVAQHLATAQQLVDARKAESDAHATLDALKAQGADGPHTLRASFRAIVTAVATSPGGIVAEGSPLLSLVQPQGLVLEVGVTPPEAAAVAAGNKVTVRPIGAGASLQSEVSLRGSVVQTTDGLVPVDIAVPPSTLFLGEMAQASITTGQIAGYVVPHVAILRNNQGKRYVVQAFNMVAKKIVVRVLGMQGDRDVIAGPLDPAAPLVLAGNHQLEDGMKMRVAENQGHATP